MSDPKQHQSQPPGRAPEEEADLSRLGGGELELEAKRNLLRETRQGAAERRKRGAIDNGVRIALLAFLALALLCALGTVVVGLTGEDPDMVRFGLVAACAIGGGSIYRLFRSGS